MQSSRIFIVGSGVVGTATGEGFLAAGHEVTFIDVSPARIRELQARGHDVRDELDLSGESDSFIFLTLPTPHAGYEYDLRAFTAGSTSVGKALAASPARHTVVVRSTVPPGTTEGLVKTVLEENSGMVAGEGFALASNPEFLRAASAAEDFRNPWMTVIASRDPQTVERLRALLSPFGGDMRTFSNPAEAEFVKCSHNIFNAAKISFWNEMWLVAREIGLDLDPIAATVAKSAEGSINPQYGIRGGAPYGGVCLPKDTCGFLGYADSVGVDMQLLRAVVAGQRAPGEGGQQRGRGRRAGGPGHRSRMTLPLYYYVLGTPLGVLGLFRWGCWLVRRIPAVLYKPVVNDFRTSISIAVPVYQEDPIIFETAIQSWLANNVEEVILVIDQSDKVCQEIASRYPVTVVITDVPGKRDALVKGWNAALDRAGRAGRLRHHLGAGRGGRGVQAVRGPPHGRRRHAAERVRQHGPAVPADRHVPRPPLLRRERQPELPRQGRLLPLRTHRGVPPLGADGDPGRVHERDVLGRPVPVGRRQAPHHAHPGVRLPDLHAAHRAGVVDVPGQPTGVPQAAPAVGAQHLALGPAGAVAPRGSGATRSSPTR